MTYDPPMSTIERLFDSALAVERHERAAFLARACSDPEIRREVESLLEADERARGFLELPVGLTPDPGDRIGSYRLLRKISDGETSSVYLAARDDGQYHQQIAIKLIRPGTDSHHVQQRFLQERQILASLIHPNIARLLDGGSTSTGQPYLVMEYVEGEPLDVYCRRHDLSIASRIELIIAVCQAIQFAHSSLVVHRDLKPSNILVGLDGTPKLLDFGIAKLLDPERVGIHIERTATSARVMTPNYASPEQVLGKSIGTGSDIYSLGVILYQLLTGSRPYELGSRSLREIERIVCESSPPLPSQQLRGAPRGRFPRDLDNIILMAMRKEPERRYASAQELAADLRRCLERRPVLAQRDTVTYRVSSFVRRNVGAVAAAAVIVLLLLGGSIATAWGWRQAVAERARAETQQHTAEQTLAFLVDLFRTPDSGIAVGQLTAREVLDRGVARLGDEARRSPVSGGALHHTLGLIYRHLGDYPRAVELLEQAVAERSTPGASQLDLAESLYHLGGLQADSGQPARALGLLQRALEIRTRLLGAGDLSVADVLEDLSSNARYRLSPAEARDYLRRAVDIRRRHPGSDDRRLSYSMAHLAELYSLGGHHRDADAQMRAALAVHARGAPGERCPAGEGEFFNDLGLLRWREGYYADAERDIDRTLECYVHVRGPDHVDVVDLSAIRIVIWREQGRYAEAEDLARRSLPLRRALHGKDSFAADNGLHHLAYVLYERGKLAEARELESESLALRERGYGPTHATFASSLSLLGDIAVASGDAAAAEPLHRRALGILEQSHGEYQPEIAMALRGLAADYLALGRLDVARSTAERGLAMQRARLRPMHPAIAHSLAVLGEILAARSPAAAEPVLREALEIRRAALGLDHPYTARAESLLGDCLVRRQRSSEALPLLRHGAEILRAQLGDDHPDARRAVRRLQAASVPAAK